MSLFLVSSAKLTHPLSEKGVVEPTSSVLYPKQHLDLATAL